jgi:hypothetical protein
LSEKYDVDSRSSVSSDFAFETFSKAGFKPISAICEIIDNSIEAEADEILLKFEWKEPTHHKANRRIEKFVFIDNGYGMNQEQIYDYFVATESDKRGKDKGIGKFGVGAYMSGISQAEKCEVYSKTNGGKWLYTNLIKGGRIPRPIVKDPPKEYVKFDNGTIVIWSETYSSFSDVDVDGESGEDLVFYLGRIYRKFLTNKKIEKGEEKTNEKKIKIRIESGSDNSVEVQPYDPTFLTCNPKQGDDTPRMLYQPVKLVTPEREGMMHIVYSFFPESWWIAYKNAGNKKENLVDRKIRGAGISLVREDRELYFGDYPGGPIKIDSSQDSPATEKTKGQNKLSDIDRFLGIEISFDKDSDEIFGVEFNKTRIIMEKFVRKKITEAISSTVQSHRRNYHDRQKEYAAEQGETDTGGGGGSPGIREKIPTPEYSSEEEKKIKEFAERYKDDTEKLEDVYQDLLNGFHISLKHKQNPNAPFVDYAYEGNSVIVMYNMEHPFMRQFFEVMETISEKFGAEPGKANSIPELAAIRELLDILLAAYGFTRTRFPNIQDKEIIEQTINTMTTNWGIAANTLAKAELDK